MEENDRIIGQCLDMCPKAERDLREREGLLHRFEMCTTHRNSQGRFYQADVMKAVKIFSRPAVGVTSPGPTSLRPGPVLIKTVYYLLNDVVSHLKDNVIDFYDFVTDRLRAVRQDMIIQRLPPSECLRIVEPMIRFYVLFGYLLCEDKRFDFHLNFIYLQECIIKAFECYSQVPDDVSQDRKIVESIYTCLNVLNPEMVFKKINHLTGTHFELIKAFTIKNYVKFFKLSLGLDLFSKAALAVHAPKIRMCYGLFSYCHAFSSNNSSYPIERVVEIFSYNSIQDVLNDCNQLGISYNNDFCLFNKKDILSIRPETVTMKRWWCVDNDIIFSELPKLLLKL